MKTIEKILDEAFYIEDDESMGNDELSERGKIAVSLVNMSKEMKAIA